jgi:protein-disulfide isomerase
MKNYPSNLKKDGPGGVRCVSRFLIAILALFLISGASAQNPEEKPAAVVEGKPVYASEFLPKLEGQIYKVRQEEYELKRKALEGVINQRLLAAEAEMWSITPEELLHQEVDSLVQEPTDEQVEQRFVVQMFRSGGQATVSKEDIHDQMMQSAVEAAREQYFQMLRQKADVKIYLLPPALKVDYDPARVRGAADAPITIVEFSDFQCPYCEQAYFMMKALLEKYSGKIKMAYRDLPLEEVKNDFHGAAVASRCAGEQGKFWEYHDLLFENQEEYGAGAFESFAASLQLDTDKFSACLKSDKYMPLVKKDLEEAVRLGATGTPAFYINGIFVNGARPMEEFVELIDALLADLK